MSAPSRRSVLLLSLLFSLLALLVLPGGAGSSGWPALITANHIGPLNIGVATRAQVTAWAGSPSKVWTKAGNGAPVVFNGLLWEYDCAGRSPVDGQRCLSLYGFVKGRLRSFWSNDTRVHTPRGTGIGTPLKTVLKREFKTKWLGWGFQCPAVILPTPFKSVTFVAQVEKKGGSGPAEVSAFYLSKAPDSFSACGS